MLALASLGGLAGLTIARFVAGGVGPMSSGVAASPMLWTSIVLPLITGVTEERLGG